MSRSIVVSCDYPECPVTFRQDDRAGSLLGWVVRRVLDSTKKRLVDGVRDFHGETLQALCPAHAEHGSKLPSPPTQHEVTAFLRQSEPG